MLKFTLRFLFVSPFFLFLCPSLISIFNIPNHISHLLLLCWFPSLYSTYYFSVSALRLRPFVSNSMAHFFSIFFLHKGRELLYKPVVFPHHLLTTVQNALWCSSHKCRSSRINYAAADALLHWVLITCIQSDLFDFPSHLHVLQTTLYFHLCIICSGCHYHIRTRLRKWSAISTSTTLWSYNPYTHINTFCLSTPTHSLWPIPAGLQSE